MQVKAAVTVILIKIMYIYFDEVYVCVFVCFSRKMTMKNPINGKILFEQK